MSFQNGNENIESSNQIDNLNQNSEHINSEHALEKTSEQNSGDNSHDDLSSYLGNNPNDNLSDNLDGNSGKIFEQTLEHGLEQDFTHTEHTSEPNPSENSGGNSEQTEAESRGKLSKAQILKAIIIFAVCQTVFIPILTALFIYYGPFTAIRENIVTSAMTTLSHKYLATAFLPKEEIDEILERNKIVLPSGDESVEQIDISGDYDGTVEIVDIKEKTYKGKLMIVHDPRRVCIGTSPTLGTSGSTLSQIVKSYNALGGVNAGGFVDDKMTGTGGIPMGIIIEGGVIKYGEHLTGQMDLVGFDKNNVLIVKTGLTVEQIKKLNIRDGISFGPPLILNGNPVIKQGNGGWGIAPRTAIGQRRDGSVLLLVIDGRQPPYSVGATLKNVQDILYKYGAVNAANLDGGSSTTMVYDGKLLNNPSDILGERAIPNAFIVKR